MVKRTSFERDDCPIARSLDAIGDWWSMLIIREALFGVSRFGEFQKKLGLAKNILTVRLRALVDQGILKTAPASDGSAYQEYLLTPKGRGVFPILVALAAMERGIRRAPGRDRHHSGRQEKGKPVRKLELYSQDGRLLSAGDTALKPRPAGKASALRRNEAALSRQLALAAQCAAVLPLRAAPCRADGRASRADGAPASLTNSATVSAMKATASSGPPSSPRSALIGLAIADSCPKPCASGRPQPCSKTCIQIAYNMAQK